MSLIFPQPTVYIASNTRTDDVFYIYAALMSSKQTMIVSGDKLRDHKAKLEPTLRRVFTIWLRSIQVHRWNIDDNTGEFIPMVSHLCIYER